MTLQELQSLSGIGRLRPLNYKVIELRHRIHKTWSEDGKYSQQSKVQPRNATGTWRLKQEQSSGALSQYSKSNSSISKLFLSDLRHVASLNHGNSSLCPQAYGYS